MKLLFSILASLSLFFISRPCPAQEISLFNGHDLTGWKGLPQYWSVKDGAIVGRVTSRNASKGNTFLVCEASLPADFDFSLKFRLVADNAEGRANSGVQFRAQISDPGRFGLKGYQIELDPGTYHPDRWPFMANISGALIDDPPGILMAAAGQKVRSLAGEVKPGMTPQIDLISLGTEVKAVASYKRNDWNDCRLIVSGNAIKAFINGILTVDVIDEGRRYSQGLLGLQLHNPLQPKTLSFKDIKLRPVNTSPVQGPGVSSSPPPAIVQTEAGQPRIQVIKDQGPNAAEWALTPLEDSIPADIRQNLTALREDLLDEGKKSPSNTPESYKLASDYCDKILMALDQRDLARVNAGYAAAQADANKRTSTEALDVRRNYMMNWPQYAREESQRAVLRESEADKADVKKQRLKVEWTTRAVQMRSYLDDLYRRMREAMR